MKLNSDISIFYPFSDVKMGSVSLHWFRKALRLHDNPALLKATESSWLIPLYILDTEYLDPRRTNANRVGFLLDSLKCLDEDLRSKGSCLFVAKGRPLDIMNSFIKEFQIQRLTFERDTEPYNKKIEDELLKSSESHQIDVQSFSGHTLFDADYLLELSGGKAPLTMKEFYKVLSLAGDPAEIYDTPKELPPPPPVEINNFDQIRIFNRVPTLSELSDFGYNSSDKTTWFKAGEQEGLRRMDNFLEQKQRVLTFEKPKTNPTSLEPDTTALSPYLTNGNLSVRLFYSKLREITSEHNNSKIIKSPVSLEGQLYWREMSYLIGYTTPNFHQMVDNPICMQIPWRDGEDAQALLDKWEAGQTGYPAVDAAMNQLKSDGWIHHLARHLLACFLTRGDLWVHWEMGRSVFEKNLIDHDWSVNNFQWHWLSCSAFFHQYFRCYGPTTFFKKTDPSGDYIRKHVPLLAKFPDEYIYNPWEAPKSVQEAAGCIIGKDYPKPIVDHKTASKDNMRKMKLAYDQAKLNNQTDPINAIDTEENTTIPKVEENIKTKNDIEKGERGD